MSATLRKAVCTAIPPTAFDSERAACPSIAAVTDALILEHADYPNKFPICVFFGYKILLRAFFRPFMDRTEVGESSDVVLGC